MNFEKFLENDIREVLSGGWDYVAYTLKDPKVRGRVKLIMLSRDKIDSAAEVAAAQKGLIGVVRYYVSIDLATAPEPEMRQEICRVTDEKSDSGVIAESMLAGAEVSEGLRSQAEKTCRQILSTVSAAESTDPN